MPCAKRRKVTSNVFDKIPFLRVGLISDTHKIFDEDIVTVLGGVDLIIHGGDVGSHGGHREILKRLNTVAPAHAVRGNVDDGVDNEELPQTLHMVINGWKILVTHIVGMPPTVDPKAAALIEQHQPHIVVFGHSHRHGQARHNGVWYINAGVVSTCTCFRYITLLPHVDLVAKRDVIRAGELMSSDSASVVPLGSAGPARFKLKRTVAILTLPKQGGEEAPQLEFVFLAAKARKA